MNNHSVIKPDKSTFSTVRGTPEEKEKLQETMARVGCKSMSHFYRLLMLAYIQAVDRAQKPEDWPEWPPQFRTRGESLERQRKETKTPTYWVKIRKPRKSQA